MKTAIHISNHKIVAVTGVDTGKKLKLGGCYRGIIPSGLIEEGAILDAPQLAAYLGGFFNMNNLKRKNVTLTVDSPQPLTKIIEVPLLPEKKLCALLRNEFADQVGEWRDIIYDYAVLRPRTSAGGGRIYAAAVEKRTVKGYKDLFAAAGIKLKGLDLAPVAAVRLCMRLPELIGRTYIFALVDGKMLMAMLFADGEYEFSSQTRIFEQRGTAAAAVEIRRALDQMSQFTFTRETRQPLSNVYISGLSEEEMAFCPDMAEALGLELGLPPASRGMVGECLQAKDMDYGEYLYCLGDIID